MIFIGVMRRRAAIAPADSLRHGGGFGAAGSPVEEPLIEIAGEMGRKAKKTKEEKRRLRAAREKERAARRSEETKAMLMQRVIDNETRKGRKVFFEDYEDGSDSVRMSEIIIDLAEPLLERARSYEEKRKVLEMAIVVWNISMLPKDKQKKLLLDFGRSLFGNPSEENRPGFAMLAEMLHRRYAHFSRIRRFIVDYELEERDGTPYLTVGHTALSDPAE